jgi:NAD-dependent DNA ligase
MKERLLKLLGHGQEAAVDRLLGVKKIEKLNPIKEEMHKLIKEIWKYKYLYYKCNQQAITDTLYLEKTKKLKELEEHYFEFCEPFTTTGRMGFHESLARQAYGDSWEEIKQTLDLLFKEPEYYDFHGMNGNGCEDFGCP